MYVSAPSWFSRRLRLLSLSGLLVIVLLSSITMGNGQFFPSPIAHADSSNASAKREVFLCVANALTMAALGGGVSVLAINASRYVLLARAAAAAAKAVTYAEYVEVTEGAAVTAASLKVTVANLLPSIATAFITTCAGGFTLFFYKDLANKLFPDGPTSDADGAAYANELTQNPSVACSSGSPDDSSGLCYDGSQYSTPGGTALGDTICGTVSPGAAFDSASGLCIGDDGSYSQPDGTNMGSCVVGFPTGSGNCINGDNNIYDPQGNPGGNANTAPDESCINYLANGNSDPCFQGFAVPEPTVTPTPPDNSNIWCVARSGVDWANWKYYQPTANFFGGIASYPVYLGASDPDSYEISVTSGQLTTPGWYGDNFEGLSTRNFAYIYYQPLYPEDCTNLRIDPSTLPPR